MDLVKMIGGKALYDKKMAAQREESRKIHAEIPGLLLDLVKGAVRAFSTGVPPGEDSDGAITLLDRVTSLQSKVRRDVDLVTRYVDMGAINASDAEIDSTDWREYYRQWRYLSRESREAGPSAEIADMLSGIEIMLATHRPGDCDCHVEKSGLRLRK